ncbi:HNH endonuclease [Anabaena cylindrica FACHB-243]|nr:MULTISPECIES: HNH endonuclease [Anabaena]MBD2419083.1 HNH endonuclease [Anabaena cylindrica FACHB-243]MBY5281231.1 HNH endonuclease [Anabaena sp. CCAP 1446/1C]MBY5310300.1 HNH endonuclease [Anabaena sp. CCAP 1446/1C]MCM2409553.1 HNH endonuclease [Anabaena sp. CCAP 1446/1C]
MSNNENLKLKTRILNRKTGKVTVKSQSLEKLIPRNRPVSQLTSEQLDRIKRIYSFVGVFVTDSFENWLKCFTLDVFPETEIKVWETITFVFVKYVEQHTLNFKQKKDVLLKLIILSSGERPKDKLSKELFVFQENLEKEILEKRSQDTNLVVEEGTNQRLKNINPWDKIDFIKLAFVYQKCLKQRDLNSNEEDDIYLKLMQLMAGGEPKDDLSRELLHALENEFEPQNITDDRERVISVVVQRKGQAKFRSDLLKAYQGKCAITGFDTKRVLQAAHIIPYLGYETNHPSNGILLRVDIHIIFDQHLLSIDPKSYEVVISPSLHGTDYQGLSGKKLLLPDKDRFKPNLIALEQHYQTFLQKCDK